MIDDEKVKNFWDSRAGTFGKVAFESIANLEEDESLLSLKVKRETKIVSELYPEIQGKSILDLGAGVGQWALRFAESGAAAVTAVEYSRELVRIGESAAKKQGLSDRLEFRTIRAQDFESKNRFDLVFISGLFVYLNDLDAELLCSKLIRFCKANSRVIVRDGTGLRSRHEINNQYSELLGANYSATYRTRREYISLFEENNFQLLTDLDMFPDGHELNKYNETRLRIYSFQPNLRVL